MIECPDEVGGIRQLKYPTPEVTEDMLENCSKYLSRGQCEVLVDELEQQMEDETRADYDDVALRITAIGMALDRKSTEVGYAR